MKPKHAWPQTSGPYDNCGTPSYAVDAILDLLPKYRIWEPAPGEGLLATALRNRGYYVVETFSDFFTTVLPEDVACIVTNPPYSIKYKWISRCWEFTGIPFALLLPVESLGVSAFWEACHNVPPNITIVLPRINFKMPDKGWGGSGAQFPTAWFSWGMGNGIRVVRQTKPQRDLAMQEVLDKE